MTNLLEIVPGYRAAVERENAIRDVAFLDLPETIGGHEVNQLTVRLLIVLSGIKSPFICGGVPDKTDAVVFLWAVSVRYTRSAKARDKFAAACAEDGSDDLATAISAYVADAFQDEPSTTGAEAIPYASWPSAIVDCLASQYGRSERDILGLPLKTAFQYMRRIVKRLNKDAVFFNASDSVKGNWLANLNAQREGK